ncbi:FtsQ-type POTRA domain-containing protein [Anaerovorax odorimutans]|uniref:FtsQ-type POTRA domain-containing protein n=1 Tax=Anaerovorax odorimutans TaxID=109327 RepID=A0ABT1RPS2_9FIRM|nr:FtsQ-type POTRA domain-containing protein [Anaerovorax odorimutans]MCQ4637191.1 FtsQ-type POTRA domain-containing protein [Anaerovorax odorimutans]
MKEHETKQFDWQPEEGALENEDKEYTEGAPEHAPSKISGKKPPKKRKRKKKRYVLKVLLLILICVGLYFFLHSSVFNIKTINTSESSHFTAQQIQEMAGLKKGMNLFEFKGGKCEDKLEENPYVQEARVKRKLPGTVSIELTERKEMAILAKDSQFVVIDGEGIVLQVAQQAPQLTFLSGVTVTEAKENEAVEVKEENVYKKAMRLLNEMEKADLYFKQIDASEVVVKAYLTDQLFCRGKARNLLSSMKEGNLQAVIFDLYKKGEKKGVINVGDDQYFSFNKKTK